MGRGTDQRHLDLLLLPVLADGPAHGYAIISYLKGSQRGAFDLPEGTVYPAAFVLWLRQVRLPDRAPGGSPAELEGLRGKAR